ncbi:MAG: MarR family transcriptional regulator [Actinoallomurus sp.]|jgi:DNA-binding MarR family transcriptional regulator|nr:MarR family transcriptional regulator [Actinoallomurus sp.]
MAEGSGVETPEDRFFRELGGAYAEIRQAFAQHVGMSAPRLQVLMRLWWNGETSHSDLRQALSLDGASVTRLIKEFEAEGMVSRRLDPADNRYTLARLTPAGERAAADLERSHQAYQVRLLDGVTAQEQEIVLGALQRLCTNVARIEPDSPTAVRPYRSDRKSR